MKKPKPRFKGWTVTDETKSITMLGIKGLPIAAGQRIIDEGQKWIVKQVSLDISSNMNTQRLDLIRELP